jgi:predicted acylesterase/phospholipase RssA
MVLSGGAAYAAYEVGVMRALFSGASPATGYTTLYPDIFTGTSAGAFNASVLLSAPASDPSSALDYLEGIWLDKVANTPSGCGNGIFRFRPAFGDLLTPGCYTDNPVQPFAELASDALFFSQDWLQRGISFFTSPVALEQRAIELVDLGTALSVDRFERLVRLVVYPAKLRECGKALRITATNWISGDVRVFRNEDLTDAVGTQVVLASSSIPGIFRPIEIEGEQYVDGSVVVNTPLKEAIDAGGDTLHVAYMDPDAQAIPLPGLRNTASAIYRIMVMSSAAMMNRDIEIARRVNENLQSAASASATERSRGHRKIAIHRYHPRDSREGVLSWLSFDRDHVADIISQGFIDASEHDCEVNKCILPNQG